MFFEVNISLYENHDTNGCVWKVFFYSHAFLGQCYKHNNVQSYACYNIVPKEGCILHKDLTT